MIAQWVDLPIGFWASLSRLYELKNFKQNTYEVSRKKTHLKSTHTLSHVSSKRSRMSCSSFRCVSVTRRLRPLLVVRGEIGQSNRPRMIFWKKGTSKCKAVGSPGST
jgi:hypothetical protein